MNEYIRMKPLCFTDLETTGLYPDQHEIIEIAAYKPGEPGYVDPSSGKPEVPRYTGQPRHRPSQFLEISPTPQVPADKSGSLQAIGVPPLESYIKDNQGLLDKIEHSQKSTTTEGK